MTFFSLMGTLTPANAGKNQVVVYTALDQVFSEPVLKSFEKKSGIKVKAVYDIEATKTTGIVNRLIAERKNPQCDVFWNNEVIRTIFLKRKKVLAPYFSALAKSIPERFKDEQGYWTGFSARARILVVNTDSLKAPDWPESIFDLTRPQWKNRVAIANPLFGTTATHAAALFQVLGSEKAKKYFLDLKKNNIAILDGNSVVKDNVGSGAFEAGFTDTDDVNMGILAKLPVKTIFPDQEGIGTLVIPNTVSIIANSPNPENGKHLIDYLLSEAVEQMLAFCPSVQMPLRPTVKTPLDFTGVNQIKAMDVDYEKITDVLDESVQFIQEIFIR
ncbi:MAG: iron ABC transporter substrate-binding protein [Gammaproteobacteria bacterium]|nr:MAG: iron ABC transporter substrate-binding protein [Gammaproteobacteria bacterium]